ncbi:MAG: hypothetical protein KGS61_07645 [Verrucomicrobia bacterium]|nr:hypothetical protein [Verrucomicrobiota bacterium]
MNDPTSIVAELARALLIEATLVVALATGFQALTASAYWRRTIWQVAALGVAALVVFETTGVARGLATWAWPRPDVTRTVSFLEPSSSGRQSTRSFAQTSQSRLTSAAARPGEIRRPTLPSESEARVSLEPGRAELPLDQAARQRRPTGAKPPRDLAMRPLHSRFGVVWLLGFGVVLVRVAVGRCLLGLFRRRRRQAVPAALQARVQALARRVGLRRRVRVLTSGGLSGPIAFGIFSPTIGLPGDSDFSPAQQEAMLAHELAHLAAHDPLWHLLAEVVSAALWWHPLVWWLRQQLRAASETAADEASLLLHGGPGILAECLVELGARLPRRASAAWMRLEGSGFRSGLGLRVARLLALDGKAWQARGRCVEWLAKIFGPGMLVVVGMMATAWTQPGATARPSSIRGAVSESWRHSVASAALWGMLGAANGTPVTPASERSPNQPLAAPNPGDRAQAAESNQSARPPEANEAALRRMLLTDGIVLFQLGELDQAEAKFRQALKQEPTNQLALGYLAWIQDQRTGNKPRPTITTGMRAQGQLVQAGSAWNSPINQNPYATTNLVRTGPGRERIEAKLARIRFQESARFDGVPLSAVVEYLNAESIKGDPDKRGINFFVVNQGKNPAAAPGTAPQIEPRTGKPIEGSSQETVGLAEVAIQLPVLHDLSLAELLDAVCKAAAQPIKYSVEEYAVIFSYRTLEPPQLYTRVYHVDPATFREALVAATGSREKSGPAASTGGARTNSAVEIEAMFRRWLVSLGLDFPTNAPVASEPDQRGAERSGSSSKKGAYYNDRNGLLFVRSFQQDLDVIDQALQVLNTAPPQVRIEAKFTQLTGLDAKALGFDWVASNPPGPAEAAAGVRSAHSAAGQSSTPASATVTGILTDPQFRVVIDSLEKRAGVDLLSAPKVTTLSGRSAKVLTVQVRNIVTGVEVGSISNRVAGATQGSPGVNYKTTPMDFGVTLNVLPTVRPDGETIQIEAKGTVKEFLGYDDPKETRLRNPGQATGHGQTLYYEEPLPRYRTQEVDGTCIVRDGQTVVLGGSVAEDVVKFKDKVAVLGDLPLVGRLFRREGTTREKKRLIIFITPTMVDTAGNRVHAEASRPGGGDNSPPHR